MEGVQAPHKQPKEPEHLRKARIEEAVRKDERERNDLASVLQLEPGQAFVMRLLARCGVYQSTFSGNHAAASFSEGQRDIGLWVLEQVQGIDPELYANLLMNHVKRQRRLTSAYPIA